MSKNEFSAKLSSYYKLRNILFCSSLKVFNFHEGAGKVPHYWLGGKGEIGQRQWEMTNSERNQTDILRRHFCE